ncbi:hypothetical protein MHH33_14300 [Paenisporosarcina sp. FSL H8-0542]|uniref:hypothetical protein n=1 Tax=Paenisporosarcina sp. FSL H8-0542 TaxID=2921401 RepID=UPI003159995C
MEKKLAHHLSIYLEQYKEPTYEVSKLPTLNNTLSQFHQWANGKPVIAAYDVAKPGEESYYFLLIDWHRNDNYYLVIYAHDKSTTIAELNKIIEENGVNFLSWKYNPLKRDGKNDIRKSYYKQIFGSTTMNIPFPTSTVEIEDFLTQLFKLCHNRVRADNIVDIYDFQ